MNREQLALVETRAESSRWPGLHELGRVACVSCAREGLRAFWPGPRSERPEMRSPEDVLGILMPLLLGRDREHGLVLSLDHRHRLIDVGQVSIGTVANTYLGPREIYREALLNGASAIVVAHNHPSGDPEPSLADVAVTKRLKEAGATIGITLIDHIVVGEADHWISMAREVGI